MIGILRLFNQISCKNEVMGKTYPCVIGGIKAFLHFPIIPFFDETGCVDDFDYTLLPPDIWRFQYKGDKSINWGEVQSPSDGQNFVENIAVSIDCEKDVVNDYAQLLYRSIDKWVYNFIVYLKLVTKQGLERDRNLGSQNCLLQLIDDKYIPDKSPISISLVFPKSETFASEIQVLDAISYADSGCDLLLEYQMLLSAYVARNQNQNRRAILDACSALEIVLVNQITHHCQPMGIIPTMITDKFRSLGDRIKLMRELDKSFPKSDYDNLIVGPRNDIMHNRKVYPSDEDTDKLISCVEKILEHYHVKYY